MSSVPLSQIFTFFLLMLGPFKVIGPFARMTRGATPQLRRQIALNSTLVSTLALFVAAFLGETILRKWGIPLSVLALAAGIILFLVLPAIFVVGLLLMPIGVVLARRKRRAAGTAEEPPRLDLRDPRLRRAGAWFAGGTLLNVAILSIASYKGVEHMDSVDFCGQSCHTVMEPEYTTFLGSPHSRVGCSGCHIGEGASWFVRSKLSGTRQIFISMMAPSSNNRRS